MLVDKMKKQKVQNVEYIPASVLDVGLHIFIFTIIKKYSNKVIPRK